MKECIYNTRPTGNFETLIFHFDGSSANNVNCTPENSTSVCSSSAVDISITQRYYVCMLFSSQDTHKNVTYNLSAYEVAYDLSGTESGERTECQLNRTDCCVPYSNIFQEMFKPTCAFIQTTALGRDNQAKELSFPFLTTSHRKWETVIYASVIGTLSFFSLVLTTLCVCGRVVYWKRHPNQCCMKVTLAGHGCSC